MMASNRSGTRKDSSIKDILTKCQGGGGGLLLLMPLGPPLTLAHLRLCKILPRPQLLAPSWRASSLRFGQT